MQPASEMQVISVNVGQPREVVWKGRTVTTEIFKEPVAGRVAVWRLKGPARKDSQLMFLPTRIEDGTLTYVYGE